MPNKHKNPTIAFRPSSEWEHALINERIRLSGMLKRDFISKSIIYSRICMVGDKKNIRIIVNAVEQMEYVMKEIVRELSSGDFCISDDSYMELKNDLLAVAITVVEILDGASYLFGKDGRFDSRHWKEQFEMEQLKDCMKRTMSDGSKKD